MGEYYHEFSDTYICIDVCVYIYIYVYIHVFLFLLSFFSIEVMARGISGSGASLPM